MILGLLNFISRRIPDTPPWTPGWRLFPAGEALQKVRKRMPIRYFSRLPGFSRLILTAALFPYWPIRILFLSVSFSRKFGQRVALTSGRQTFVQFAEQYFLALACGVHPREYYAYELFRKEQWNSAHLYYYLSDTRRTGITNIGRKPITHAIVNNKKDFEEFCVANGLPHVSSRAAIYKEKNIRFDEIINTLSDGSYVLKPFVGLRGEGVILFSLSNKRLRIIGNEKLRTADTISRISFFIKNREYLLQPRLYNHEGLKKIGNGSLVTFRIVSLLNKQGQAELLSAVAQIPFEAQLVSNKGLIAPVDENGTLGKGQFLRPLSPIFNCPPEGGEIFSGTQIPCWREAVELALKAHTTLGAFVSLGWDVAITPDGPVLLETNCGWDPGMMQKTHQTPLGKTMLPEMLLHYSSMEQSAVTIHQRIK